MTAEKAECMEHANNILIQIHEMKNKRQFCDVVLVAGIDKKRIEAHRVLLAAASRYFLAMFRRSSQESVEVTLDNVRGDVLEKLIDYCYTGRFEICKNAVMEHFTTANMLQLNDVSTCADHFVKELNASNCLKLMYLAEEHNCQKLFDKSTACASANFMELCKTQEFLELSINQVCRLIARDGLYVDKEELVFKSIKAWIRCNFVDRKRYFPRLMQLVRLACVKKSFIIKFVQPVCILHKCERLLTRNNAELIRKWKPRKPKQLILAVFHSNATDKDSMHFYEPNLDRWYASHMNLTEVKRVYAITAWNENLYLIGISSADEFCLFAYDGKECKWRKLAVMQTSREFCSVAVVGRFLYTIGGKTIENNEKVNIVERWDFYNNSWSSVANMPTKRSRASVAVLDNCLYVISGCAYELNALECYNTITNEWSIKAFTCNNSEYCKYFRLATCKGTLYAFGMCTFTFKSLVERYDKEKNEWTEIFRSQEWFFLFNTVSFERTFFVTHSDGNISAFDPIDLKIEEKTPYNYTSRIISSVIIPNKMPHLFEENFLEMIS